MRNALRRDDGSCLGVIMIALLVVGFLLYIGMQEETSEPEEIVEVDALRNELVKLSYDDLARYPDEHKGKAVKYQGQIVQKASDSVLRVNITRGEFGFWENTVWIDLKGQAKEARILEDDVIEFVGITNGTRTYTAIFGNTITVPKITAYEITLLSKAK
ncbi:MAG: hypothetical protein GX986_04915 [Firmicutes bacterium]|nr:hypothetical protein [Bacillota bacterium]